MKIFHKIISILILILTFAQTAYAITDATAPITVKPYTLEDCIQKALDNSPYIKKQKINYEMSKKDIKIAQSVYFPTISAGVGAGYDYSKLNTAKRSNNTTALDFTASVKQLIWNFGKATANIRMEKFNRIAAYYDFDTQVLNTIFDVKTQYYTVLAAKAAIEVDKSNLQINERNYQRTQAYFDEGLKSKIDLVNAEVYVTEAKTNLISSENLYKNALIELNNVMFLAYNPIYEIEVPSQFVTIRDYTPKTLTDFSQPIDDLLAPPRSVDDALLTANVSTTDFVSVYKFDKFPYNFEQCIELANKNRPDIKALNAALDAINQYLLVVKRNYFPELTAKGGYGLNGANSNSVDSTKNSFSIGLELTSSVNIMSEKYKIDNAKLQVDLAQNEIDLLKQDVYFQVQKLYVNMMQFEEQIPLLEQKVRQTLENLELADGRYAVGLGDYIELQDAKVNYNVAQHAFIKSVFNYNLAKARLEQAIALEQDVTVNLEDKL